MLSFVGAFHSVDEIFFEKMSNLYLAKSLIAVFIDGTMNRAVPSSDEGRTNVRRLFEEFVTLNDIACLYIPGVGCIPDVEMDLSSSENGGLVRAVNTLLATERSRSNPFKGLFGGWFGSGLTARVVAAYAFICALKGQYPGAQICLIGFSRGAYAICVLAHFMARAGLLVAKSNLGLLAPRAREAWTYDDKKLAASIKSGDSKEWKLPENAESISVDFLGCWDTVCAMGAPKNGVRLDLKVPSIGAVIDGLCSTVHNQVQKWNPNFVSVFIPPNVVKARHALALHEFRVSFEPLLWESTEQSQKSTIQNISQVWFPGAHADVGGGYKETSDALVLSSHTLDWMKHEMWSKRWSSPNLVTGEWPIHDSSEGKFAKFKPDTRICLLSASTNQYKNISISDSLKNGLSSDPIVRICDTKMEKTSSSSRVNLRSELIPLVEKAHNQALLIWLREELARALAAGEDEAIPPNYDDPTCEEAFEALSMDSDQFFRELSPSSLAMMVKDQKKADKFARLFCFHLCFIRVSGLSTSTALRTVIASLAEDGSDCISEILEYIFFAPLKFVLGGHIHDSVKSYVVIDLLLRKGIESPSGKMLKIQFKI